MKKMCCICLLLAATCFAQDAVNTLSEAEKADGWALLFDGTSLDGWNSWKTKSPAEPGSWAAKDGALTLVKKGGGDLYTVKGYTNFEFSLEYKTTGNSGVFVRVDPAHKGAIWNKAPEVQVERDAGNKSTSAGGLYALYEIEGEKKIDPDGWNELRIRIQDNKATHWFNGTQTCSFTYGSDDWNERVAKSKFKKFPGFAMKEDGHLGLQDHGHTVAFRNIKIRVLP